MRQFFFVGVCAGAVAGAACAETRLGYTTYGTSGIIEMPSAYAMSDGELALTSSHFLNTHRNTLTFQILPRLSGSFRYSMLYDRDASDANDLGVATGFRFDRSFSLQYLIAEETDRRPAIAIGLNDFLGTGVYRSEYLVASKSLTPRLRVSGGIGWGRLAGVGGFSNPLGVLHDGFKTRPARTGNTGGQAEFSGIFRGDAALFGGVEYQASDKLKLMFEYSSDRYVLEDGASFDYGSPYNFGLSYKLHRNVDLNAYYLYGSEFGVQLTYAIDPQHPRHPSGLDKAPPAVVPRALSAAQLGWNVGATAQAEILDRARTALSQTQVDLHGLRIEGNHARVEIENGTYFTHAQAIGRTARALSGVLPAHVESVTVIPVSKGIAGASVTLQREDLEELEFDLDGAWKAYARADIESHTGPLSPDPALFPRFDVHLKPYFATSFFDPDQPFRADLGAELSARYEPFPGLIFDGAIRKKLVGNLDTSTRESDSKIRRVRSEFALYDKAGDPVITNLTANYFFKPGKDLYGRVTAGYLEQQYGGVSTELLWKPIDSRLALGVEINHVRQRNFDQLLGFRDYETTTGHVSAYYDFENGFRAQLDVGRYLAQDWGGTLSIDRTFKNGWSIGAFATLTDVSFDDFGEGSFDKGIRVTIPINWISGQPRRDRYTTTIRPVTRDGGARVETPDRLYDVINDMHKPALQNGWGRFWR